MSNLLDNTPTIKSSDILLFIHSSQLAATQLSSGWRDKDLKMNTEPMETKINGYDIKQAFTTLKNGGWYAFNTFFIAEMKKTMIYLRKYTWMHLLIPTWYMDFLFLIQVPYWTLH